MNANPIFLPLLTPLSFPFHPAGLSLLFLSSLILHHSPLRDPHPGSQGPSLQCDALTHAEGGASQDQEEAAGQRRPLHLGDGRGQVHAALLPYRFLAFL